MLDISYQAAKNYLAGNRLPDTNGLLAIARETGYSIQWFLTGEGEKSVQTAPREDTLTLSAKSQEFVRGECREIINEVLSSQNENAQSRAVVLPTEKIMEEKVLDQTGTFSENERSIAVCKIFELIFIRISRSDICE